MFLLEEAQNCRDLAVAFEGKGERSFLLKAAQAFEELAMAGTPWQVTRQSNKGPRERIRLF
jgi:hypothetical protein